MTDWTEKDYYVKGIMVGYAFAFARNNGILWGKPMRLRMLPIKENLTEESDIY